MTDLRTVSLFAGIGGIDRGLELAGAKTALMCELDPHARKILARHYPHAAIHNDVTELTADDCRAAGAVPGRTVLTAGWPCQGNSVAGARGGMDDPRSGLWSHVVRLLAEHRPAWFIGENVPGLLSVNEGRDFSIVVHDLARLGYGFCWRILDARHFGVPQRRRRVVIVGRLGDTGAAAAQVLLEPEGVPGNPAAGIKPRKSTASAAREGSANGRVVGVLGDHTHTLTAEGHDASEDGTGRGTPVISVSNDSTPVALIDEVSTLKVGTGLGIPSQHAIAYTPEFAPALTTRAGNTQDDQQTGQLITYAAQEVSTLQAAGGERGYRIDAEAAAGGHLVSLLDPSGARHADATQTHARKVLHGLRDALGAQGLREWSARVADPLQSSAVLRPDVHAGGVPQEAEDVLRQLVDHAQAGSLAEAGWALRALRESGQDGRASHRRGLAEQLAGELEAALSGLPPTDSQGVIVRRLTPLELERLQGFPDGWTEGQADSHRSKQLGNSVAVPVFEWVGRRLVAVDSALEAA